jgi:glycosyltransferase involved in cell wall biosynthesis
MIQPEQQPPAAGMHGADNDQRPGLAIVANSITPYRVHLHRLIAAGIPELKLHTLITHGVGDFDWQVNLPPEIHAANFSAAGEHPLDNPLRRPWIEVRKSKRIIRYLRENDAHAVIFTGYRYISYLRVMDYCYRHHIPFFLRSDSNIRSEPELSFIQRIVKSRIYAWWMKRAAGIMSMGQFGDEFFLKYGADPKRLYRVPYWPDFNVFANVDSAALERFQQKYRLNRSRRHLMYSGRLVPDKRVDLLIDAFAAIASERPDWDLLLVGDGALAEELRRRVPEALRPRVVWTGFIDGDDIVPAYHSAEVLVLASDQEPWALVIQEAMAAGMTVVASDVVGAARELLTDGISGRVFAKGDCNALKRALLDITRPDRIDAYKQQAKTALLEYRQRVNPVAEIRRAMVDVSILNNAASAIENTNPTSVPWHIATH